MARLFDRVGMTTATTGTGTITLGSAITDATNGDLRSFATAGAADQDPVKYLIVDGNAWEIGIGSYTSAGTTLSRGLISSSSGSLISLSGSAKVYCAETVAEIAPDHPGYVSANFYPTLLLAGAPASATLSAGTIRLTPVLIKDRVTISQLGGRVTANTASNIQFALYNISPTSKKPTTLLANTASQSGATVGGITAALAGGNITLEPGFYWLGVNSDAAPALAGIGATILSTAFLIGSPTQNSALGQSALITGYTFAQTFGTWPDLTGQTMVESTAILPIATFKVA